MAMAASPVRARDLVLFISSFLVGTAVLTEFVAAAATNPSLQPHLDAVSGAWQDGIERMLWAAEKRGELGKDAAVTLLAEMLSALTLTRVIFQRTPVDDTLRDDLRTLVRHPPRRS